MQHGYYMIGRDQECQIRPKSRSVSRHHCLLFHDQQGLRVLDLESTSGTRINEQRVVPKKWMPLGDGDLLRCGKIVFRIGLEEHQQTDASAESSADRSVSAEKAGASARPAAVAAGGDRGSMISGEAWHEVDIADYLGAEDDADRERRYDEIRVRNQASESGIEFDTDAEVDIFADDYDDSLPSQRNGAPATEKPSSSDRSASTSAPASNSSAASAASVPASTGHGKSKSAKEKRNFKPIPKRKRKRLSRSYSGWFSGFGDVERLKMIAAVLLLCGAVGILGYSLYSFARGPQVRVLNEID